MQVFGHSLGIITFSGLALWAFERHQEKRADLMSAASLELAHEARVLVEKKIQQNLAARNAGTITVTKSGNDITEFHHPYLTEQLKYLLQLEQQQQRQVIEDPEPPVNF
jgi:hypothetical protein